MKTVRITGAKSLRRVLRQAPNDVKAELVEAVASSAAEMERGMLARVPRDKGDLASVIKTKPSRDGLSARVGPGVKGKRDMRKAGWRAKFVEFGTQDQEAQSFVFSTAKDQRPRVRARVSAAIASALTKIAGRGRG